MTSPTDTRYPPAAILGGFVTAASVIGIGALFSLLTPPVGALVVGGIAAVAGAFVGSSIKFADQWEKAVVLRLGKY
ncbi:MAG: hypothetical protein OER89_15315, partial [Gemmatimonadota bacterium]|nr:hypothetical protein [Gemmatimonadota bacterium]